jgi:hypothetical protein
MIPDMMIYYSLFPSFVGCVDQRGNSQGARARKYCGILPLRAYLSA